MPLIIWIIILCPFIFFNLSLLIQENTLLTVTRERNQIRCLPLDNPAAMLPELCSKLWYSSTRSPLPFIPPFEKLIFEIPNRRKNESLISMLYL